MDSNGRYVLDANGVPVEEPDLMKWAQWLETADRRVAVDTVNHFRVSTVFLGLDHRFGRRGPPLLFETMVFYEGTARDQLCCRYATREQAEQGHKEIVARATNDPVSLL